MYQLIVDAILGLHLAYIVFVLFGGLLVLRYPRLAWLHLPAAAWGAIVEFMDWLCPLTTWENHFRDLAAASAYHGDFVSHYLLRIIYPPALTPDVRLLLGGIVVMLNLAIYAVIFTRAKRRALANSKRKRM